MQKKPFTASALVPIIDIFICMTPVQEQANKAESLVRLHNGIANAAEALGRLAGEELTGAQAEHLEEEAIAKVTLQDTTSPL